MESLSIFKIALLPLANPFLHCVTGSMAVSQCGADEQSAGIIVLGVNAQSKIV